MTATISRHWRYGLLACLVTAILVLSHNSGSSETSHSLIPRIEGVEEIGLEAFLAHQTALLDVGGTIGIQAYEVPSHFGKGTTANMTASMFPHITIGHAFQPLPLDKSSIGTRPDDPPVVEMTGEAFNPAILKMPFGIARGWEYIVVARGPRVERGDLWVEESGRYAEEHGLVA